MEDSRREGLKFYVDWSKWLAAFETAMLAALYLRLLNSSPHWPELIAGTLAIAFLFLSLWGACQFLFSVAGVVMNPPPEQGLTTFQLREPDFRFSLGTYHRIQLVALGVAVVCMLTYAWLAMNKENLRAEPQAPAYSWHPSHFPATTGGPEPTTSHSAWRMV